MEKIEKRHIKTLIATVFLAMFLSLLMNAFMTNAIADQQAGKSESTELEKEKLRQEIRKLDLENKKLGNFWEITSSFATLLTAAAAVVGLMVTIWKQTSENRRQQELDRHQRELDRNQREGESLRRLDEKFTSTVANFGSKSPAIQATAAVSIITFLKPEYKAFHEQVFQILLANVKIKHADSINKLIIDSFEKAIRIHLQSPREKIGELDLSGAYLHNMDLSELDLREADLGFVQLRCANLEQSNLSRVRGIEAHLEKARLSRADLTEARFRKAYFQSAQFHESRLISADMKETDLTDAHFNKSKMQSAHFENAKIRGARFEQADINDAFFIGAEIDEISLKSLVRAYNWQNAHFDPEVKIAIEECANKLKLKQKA